MTTALYTKSQQEHAELLVSRSKFWTRATRKSDGLAFVVFPSSQSGTSYYSTSRGCTCKSYLFRGRCCHQLAVSMVEAARKPSPRPLVRYEDVYGADDDDDRYGNVSAF